MTAAAALVDHYIGGIFPTSARAAAQTCHLGTDKKKPRKSSKRAARRQQGICLKLQFVVDHIRESARTLRQTRYDNSSPNGSQFYLLISTRMFFLFVFLRVCELGISRCPISNLKLSFSLLFLFIFGLELKVVCNLH